VSAGGGHPNGGAWLERWAKRIGVVVAALLAVVGLLAMVVDAIRKPILEGLEAERLARVADRSSLMTEIQTMRTGQIYMLEAMDAAPESRERERILRSARRVLYYGPQVPADSHN
jgi:uncharacterized membrane protein